MKASKVRKKQWKKIVCMKKLFLLFIKTEKEMKSLWIQDEHPRPETTIEKLANLNQYLKVEQLQLAMLQVSMMVHRLYFLMSAEKAKELGSKTSCQICCRSNSGT